MKNINTFIKILIPVKLFAGQGESDPETCRILRVFGQCSGLAKKVFLVFSAVSAMLYASGCSPDSDSLLAGNWEMVIIEDKSIPVNDSLQWQPVTLPAMFRHPSIKKGEYSHLWLRGEVEIPADPDRFSGIHLGRVYHSDITYINGTMVGTHSLEKILSVHAPRNYSIPAGVLKQGKNTIHVYLGIYGREFGGSGDLPVIMTGDAFLQRTIIDNFIYSQLPIGIIIFLMAQAVFNLALFYYNRSEKVNVYGALILFCWSSYIFSLFSPWFPFSNDARITFLWSCPASFSILYMLFMEAYYKCYLPWYNRIVIPLFGIITLVIWMFPDTTSPFYPGRILGTAAMFTAAVLLSLVMYSIKQVKKDASVSLFIMLGFMPGTFILWDVTSYLFIFHIPPMTHTYTIPVISTWVMMYIIRDLVSSKTALALLYGKLNVTDAGDRGYTVTSTAEDKLKRVIAFIDENFASDLSREGLAASIGISPDHLSRLFMSYTGKKIQNYINDLRIIQARKLLLDTDMRIIDIAFAVGYENLATFNRLFHNITGLTPSDFRKTGRN